MISLGVDIGGTGIQKEYISLGIAEGNCKINVGSEIRQPYERGLSQAAGLLHAQEAVYPRTRDLISDFLGAKNSADILMTGLQ